MPLARGRWHMAQSQASTRGPALLLERAIMCMLAGWNLSPALPYTSALSLVL